VTVALSLQALEETGALTATGLKLTDPQLPYDRYEAIGTLLGRAYRELIGSIQWAIGDWLLLGETLYGDEAYQAFESLEMSPEGRNQYLRCALVYPPNRRRGALSWSHHRTLIALEPEEQDRWLALAEQNGWSNSELHQNLRAEVDPVPTGRAVSATTQHNPNSRLEARSYVVEAVEDSAREVCLRAVPHAAVDGQLASYLVPADALRTLTHALGLPPLADAPTTIGAREEAA
jgi:hypothetical protein